MCSYLRQYLFTDIFVCMLSEEALPGKESEDLAQWMNNVLGKSKVVGVKVSKRLVNTNHPAMITVPDMVAAKHWLKLIKSEQNNKDIGDAKFQIIQPTLEINPKYGLLSVKL